jgi:sugar fermentation stimulation protein A
MRGLVAGRVIRRYKRFLADMELSDGRRVTAHTTNTGTMRTCWEPGDLVLLERHDDPGRKLQYTWIACLRGRTWVGVDTRVPNRIVAEAVRRDLLPGLPGLRFLRTEVPYGVERSRVDVLAEDASGRSVYLEVKNTTLRIGDWACFPDAVTERGTRHLRELAGMVALGHRAALVFAVQRNDVDAFDAAREVDPVYARTLDKAAAAGVVVLPLALRIRVALGAGATYHLAWDLAGLLPWVRREAGPL